MAQFSTYLGNKLLDHVLKNTAYTPPSAIYLALYESDPGVDNSGTEVSGGSYARQTVAFNSATGRSSKSSASESFTGMPDAIITHIALLDASTEGNLLVFDALDNPIATNNGDEITIDAAGIEVLLKGA